MEGLSEEDEVERSLAWVPVLELRLFDVEAVFEGHTRHPGIGLHGKNICTGIAQLRRGDPGSCPDVEDVDAVVTNEAADQAVWVTRAVAPIIGGNQTKRARPTSIAMGRRWSPHTPSMRGL